jgi:hypothetical protein
MASGPSLVFSASWVYVRLRPRLWRHGSVYLYTVSHVEVWKGEEP